MIIISNIPINTVWIDTNIIIRFLTSDHPTMTPETAVLMKRAEDGQIKLKIVSMIIAECCWVLQSPQYNFSPSDISSVLITLITASGIEMDEKDVILEALENYSKYHVDFIDAYLAARARIENPAYIITYNTKDFRNLGVNVSKPTDISFY